MFEFHVEDIQFSTAKGNWPYKAARRNTRAGLLALYLVKTYCRVHTNRNRLLFEITITKNFGQGTGGGHGGGGQREMAISDRTMHSVRSLFNYEQRKVKHYQEVQIIAEDYDIVLSRRQYY